MNARPVSSRPPTLTSSIWRHSSGSALLERRAEHHAGVGDDEVDRAERVVDAFGEAVGPRDVGGDGDGALAELGGERVESLLAAADERDGGAGGVRARGRWRCRCRRWRR